MRILCPTCKYLDSGEAFKDGYMCILHNNPDERKYFCMCQGKVTKQELRRYYKNITDQGLVNLNKPNT